MKNKKIWKIIIGAVIFIAIAGIINFSPVWKLRTDGMKVIEGKFVDVYYETEEPAALDVFEQADLWAEKIEYKLFFDKFMETKNVNIYIYDKQITMQTKKYGYFAAFLNLDWYIGDNIGTDVILTSPANPGKEHSYDSIKDAVAHEIVHAYISVINPDISLWLTEGMALYIANGEPFYKEYLSQYSLPSYKDIQTKNPIKFADMGGYDLAHTYIEYLEKQYGWEKVIEIISGKKYYDVLKKSDKDIYLEWIEYLKNYQ